MMPRYFFHLRDGAHRLDATGAELPDHDAAREAAGAFLANHLRAGSAAIWSDDGLCLEVADANGLILFSLHVVPVEAPAMRQGPDR